jgi:hypothetical protein
MKLEAIFELWAVDSLVNRDALDTEALRISNLHHKYHKIYTNERLTLRKYEADFKVLKLEKYEFYTQGPTKETHEKGWQLPPIGKLLKADAGNYVEADSDVIELSLKIGIQHEKIELLESIIKTIMNRGFQIKTAVDWIKFQSGG